MTPNPWALLPEQRPFVAALDAKAVEEIDRWARQEPARLHAYGLQTQLFPEPFIGRVDAPVVLWTANPGYADEERVRKNTPLMSGTDDWWHANSVALREASAANLAHRDQPYRLSPISYLRPIISVSSRRNTARSALHSSHRFRGSQQDPTLRRNPCQGMKSSISN